MENQYKEKKSKIYRPVSARDKCHFKELFVHKSKVAYLKKIEKKGSVVHFFSGCQI